MVQAPARAKTSPVVRANNDFLCLFSVSIWFKQSKHTLHINSNGHQKTF